eukprot:CAMPEP_0204222678 /NCGR_PEP_ID=MMETSP0361-20130328/82373_1 /ASSEMBLY_ACC=CAM_ASM_000343 /TAXON_ID=268821 /ORGANISM="Scrippsiella Hangoei, Strain SHTV-5" /LENGTH=69 /DNA_ID=CAMNT_0051188331 /DNA_START=73 /DNA_END=278 /DNA_ORIENTATION=+
MSGGYLHLNGDEPQLRAQKQQAAHSARWALGCFAAVVAAFTVGRQTVPSVNIGAPVQMAGDAPWSPWVP